MDITGVLHNYGVLMVYGQVLDIKVVGVCEGNLLMLGGGRFDGVVRGRICGYMPYIASGPITGPETRCLLWFLVTRIARKHRKIRRQHPISREHSRAPLFCIEVFFFMFLCPRISTSQDFSQAFPKPVDREGFGFVST